MSTAATATPVRAESRVAAISRTPFGRIMRVELRKMFDTRSGFWLMASVVLLSIVATAATLVFVDAEDLTYEHFASAVGFPMTVILPIIAILAVSSEWSQRTALTTFTLVPHRGRILAAKSIVAVAVGVVSMLIAGVVGAVGTVIGSAIAGVDPVWNVSVSEFSHIVLANEVGMLMGLMLGIVLRNSPGAIVAYFVYSFVLPGASSALAGTQQWWADNGPWLDLNWASMRLFEASLTGEMWAQLATSAVLWLLIPLAIGTRALLRSEVK